MTGRGRPGHDHIDTCTLGSGAAVMTHPRIPTHKHAHTKPETSTYRQPKYNFPSSFMDQSKGCPNHLFFFSSCRYFIAPKWLLLSSLPLHLFDWQMGEKTANGDRAGGQSWDCVSWLVRVGVLAALRVASADEKGRWDVAGPYLKASLRCPLNQCWRSLMVHHRHVILR